MSPVARQVLFDPVPAVASQIHEAWRAARQLPDGTFEPRWKDDDTVDNADTPFSELPAKWQAENLAAAQSALAAVRACRTLEEAADQIHQDWLARNGAWAPAEQAKPYPALSEREKDKDRAVARIAATVSRVHLD